ncbi:hypothetical protein HS125_11930 [bacterium]|nr:hypothetical protein [bacterium]
MPSPREAAELERKLAEARRARQEGADRPCRTAGPVQGRLRRRSDRPASARGLGRTATSRARAAARRLAETTDRMAREAARQEGLDATERRRLGALIADP